MRLWHFGLVDWSPSSSRRLTARECWDHDWCGFLCYLALPWESRTTEQIGIHNPSDSAVGVGQNVFCAVGANRNSGNVLLLLVYPLPTIGNTVTLVLTRTIHYPWCLATRNLRCSASTALNVDV